MNARFDNTDRERVREAADIVRVIGEHVALRSRGREYIGLCPFHDDHSPSMGVVPHKQIYKCHACGAGGDVFTFVQRHLKMDFREALEYLAERFGVTLAPARPRPEPRPGEAPAESEAVARSDLFAASRVAAEFFRVILRHPEHGAPAREVAARRGISPEMQEQFMIGASPAMWDGLLRTLRGKGMSERAYAEAGLLKRRDDGSGFYDAFRHRLMFPILDKAGRVVAFGGRIINPDDEPKYLNSAESRIFRKSATLYALTVASRAIQRERTALVTEGYMDTIACHQAGFANAVATLGTALTPEHAAELRRLCETVILVFDGDQAGLRASDRAVEVFFAEPIDVRICTLASVSDAKDPDELLKREGGPELFRRALQRSADLLDYRFARIKQRLADAGTSALARAIEEEIQRLVDLGLADLTPVRQALIVRRLSELARVDESVIRAAIPSGRGARPRRAAQADEPVRRTILASGKLTAREAAMGCVLCEPSLWFAVPDAVRAALRVEHREPAIAAVLAAIARIASRGDSPGLQAVISDAAEDADAVEAAVNLAQRVEQETDHRPERLRSYWGDCVRRIEQDLATAHVRDAEDRSITVSDAGSSADESAADPGAMRGEGQARDESTLDLRSLERHITSLRARGRDARVFPRRG